MLTKQDICAAGYLKYKSHKDGSDGLFQKRVRDGQGKTLYFINIYHWDFSSMAMPDEAREANSWSVEVQLYTETEFFDLSLRLAAESTIVGIEKFYERMYTAMGCVPDRDNN